MRSVAAVLLLTAIAGAAAWPSSFWSVTSYSGTTCAGTATIGPVYHAIGQCEPTGGITIKANMYTASSAGVITVNTYTAADCSGTGVALNQTFTNALCLATLGSSSKYAYPDTTPLWASTTYATADCSGAATDISYSTLNACNSQGDGTYVIVTQSGHSINYCQYTDAACTAGQTCQSANSGVCTSIGTSSNPASVMTTVNSAMAAAPKVAIAVAAIVLAAFGASL